MTAAYLALNGILYVLFALWCTAFPAKTAGALGFAFQNGSGKSEYITVYGGLEAGVAIFFLLAAIRPGMRDAGLLFAICFYACLVLWRIPTLLLIPGVQRTTYFFAGAEFVLLLGALAVRFLVRAPAS